MANFELRLCIASAISGWKYARAPGGTCDARSATIDGVGLGCAAAAALASTVMFIELVIVPDDINCAVIDIGGNREAKNDYGNERAKTFCAGYTMETVQRAMLEPNVTE